MEAAKVYAIREGVYSHMVLFRRRGSPTHKRRFRDVAAAEAYRDEFNRRLVDEGAQGLHVGAREREHIAQAYRILEGTGLTLVQAAEIAAGKERDAGANMPWARAVDEFLTEKERMGRAVGTVNELIYRLRGFERFSGATRLRDFTRVAVEAFVGRESAANARNHLGVLSSFGAWLVRQDYLAANPCAKIARPALDVRPIDTFSVDEAALFMARLEREQPMFAAFYAVLLFAFLRPSEAVAVRGGDIRGDRIWVGAAGKMRGRGRRWAPVADNLAAWLEAYVWAVPSEWAGELCRGLAGRWSHDICRHSGISYRLALVADEHQVAREAGNSPAMIFGHYHDPKTVAEAEAYFAIRPQRA